MNIINFTLIFLMRSFLAILLLLTCYSVFSQEKQEIDPRLLVSKDLAEKAQYYFKNDPQAYEFLLFELDNAYFIIDIESEPGNKSLLRSIDGIISADGKPFDPSVLNNKQSFNFHEYNFRREETQTIPYDLGNGQAIVFYSGKKLRAKFNQR